MISCAPEKQFFNWDRSPKSISLGYRHQPVADIRLPAAEGGCNRCVWIYVAMNAQPREVDWGLRVFNQSAARTHTDISCNRTEAPTPFPLATRGDSSWRFRQTARGARSWAGIWPTFRPLYRRLSASCVQWAVGPRWPTTRLRFWCFSTPTTRTTRKVLSFRF